MGDYWSERIWMHCLIHSPAIPLGAESTGKMPVGLNRLEACLPFQDKAGSPSAETGKMPVFLCLRIPFLILLFFMGWIGRTGAWVASRDDARSSAQSSKRLLPPSAPLIMKSTLTLSTVAQRQLGTVRCK